MYPILSALRHHKSTVALVALEIALTCAIITNALFLIRDRLDFMHMTTGVDDSHLVWATTNDLHFGQKITSTSRASQAAADSQALASIPDVQSVAMTSSLPLNGDYFSIAIDRKAGDSHGAVSNVVEYQVTPDFVKTVGIKISEGRDFLPQEYADYDPFKKEGVPPKVAIITRELANELWPGEKPLGREIFLSNSDSSAVRIIGVTDHLLNPSINNFQGIDRSLILPVRALFFNPTYVLRVVPMDRQAVKRSIPKVLLKVNPIRTVKAHIYTHTIHQYFGNDRAMVWLLVVVIGCLLALTALGVVGLFSFWVQQRTKTIGIRRAIGATRSDILRYFLVENFLIVGAGVVTGSVCAVGLNLWLMRHYELHRMPLTWLPAGALVLWGLGLLAVLGPALRASRVPPVVATRSV